jgi:Zn-finger nucleic acid-binding protein
MKCKSCGINLTALNLSDIEEDWCTKCVDIMIEKMHPIPEDNSPYIRAGDPKSCNPIDPRADIIRATLQSYEWMQQSRFLCKDD